MVSEGTCREHLTIIPRVIVGYEMKDSQQGM